MILHCSSTHAHHIRRDIPLVLCAYLIWKFTKKTKFRALKDIPLADALRQAELEEVARVPSYYD